MSYNFLKKNCSAHFADRYMYEKVSERSEGMVANFVINYVSQSNAELQFLMIK